MNVCERCGLTVAQCHLWFGGGACPILTRPNNWRLRVVPWRPSPGTIDLLRDPRIARAIADAARVWAYGTYPLRVELPDGRTIELMPT